MNTTKCRECGRDIVLPDGIDPDYEKADKEHDEDDKQEYPFCLPSEEDRKLLEDEQENLAHCAPEMGGYYCATCFEKERQKLEDTIEDEGSWVSRAADF